MLKYQMIFVKTFAAWSILWLTAIGQTVPADSNRPDSNRPSSAGSESLGNQLLDDLPVAVPQPPNKQPGEKLDTVTNEQPAAPMSRTDEGGDDIGGRSGPLPLARVRDTMRRAETLLSNSPVAVNAAQLQQAGEAQRQVVAQLDELIAELSKQCQGGQGQPNGNASPQPSQGSKAKPDRAGSGQRPGQSPARDSSDQLNRSHAKSHETVEVDEVVKRLWGHLPERSRDQVLQSFSDEFLPKYELEIEQYYRQLSEEHDERPQQ